ncbi:MAG TPA: phosphotransferase [Ktedonobacteraceae bacterium]|jgi:aminoglycoside phosphotransferase (APT) family kinase protein|nr:phosphotransferase [Ktedonobacteraceae bacterium]
MIDEQLDPQAILQTLGLLDITSVVSVQGGTDTAIWRVESAGRMYALRVFQRGQHDDCQQEHVVMEAARAAGLPVPHVHAEGTWCEHPALLLSWLPGKPIAEELYAHPWRAWRLGVMFGRMHAAIHDITAPDLLCQPPDGWMRWQGLDDPPLQERLRAISHQSNVLLHLDYHPFNILTDGNRITGVLDWRNAGAGDPRADVARTVSILRIENIDGKRLSFQEIALRRVFEAGWRRGYGQKKTALGNLSLFYAWAGAVMERDLGAKREQAHLTHIHKWTMRWKKRAGLSLHSRV